MKAVLIFFLQKFKRFEVSRVCLDCMLAVPESVDRHITRMAVAIVSVLACKVCSYRALSFRCECTKFTRLSMFLFAQLCDTEYSKNRRIRDYNFEMSLLVFLGDEVVAVIRLRILVTGPNAHARKIDS